MQREAVADGVHAELAHAVVDVVARLARGHRRAARPVREHGAGEVRGAPDQLGQARRQRLDRLLRGLARGDGLALRGLIAHELRGHLRRSRAAARPRCAARTRRRGRGTRPCTRRSAPATRPRASRRPARWFQASLTRRRHHEGLVRPADRGARGRDFLLAQRGAVAVGGAGLGRRALADDGLAAHERGTLVLALRRHDRAVRPPRRRGRRRRGSRSSRTPRSAAGVSSVNQPSTLPSMEMPLSS